MNLKEFIESVSSQQINFGDMLNLYTDNSTQGKGMLMGISLRMLGGNEETGENEVVIIDIDLIKKLEYDKESFLNNIKQKTVN
jgi:hypothetical protein